MTDSKMPDILYAWPAEGEKSPGVMLCGQWSVTRYPDQAEEYRKAAPVADAGKRDGMAAYDCQKCGRRIPVDTVVADEVWRAISPTGDEGGLLCAACIADALAASGWPAVRMINAHPAPEADAELEALLQRMGEIVLSPYAGRDALIHDCDLGQITMGDISDLITALRARTAQPVGVRVPDGLIDALRSGRQADADGCMVFVSRQACEEAAAILSALLPAGGA